MDYLRFPNSRPSHFGREISRKSNKFASGMGPQSSWGEHSDPRTAENEPENQPFIQFIGRKRFTLSALSSGEVSKGGGVCCDGKHCQFLLHLLDMLRGVSDRNMSSKNLTKHEGSPDANSFCIGAGSQGSYPF